VGFCYRCDEEFSVCEWHSEFHSCPLKNRNFLPLTIHSGMRDAMIIKRLIRSFNEEERLFSFLFKVIKVVGKVKVVDYYQRCQCVMCEPLFAGHSPCGVFLKLIKDDGHVLK